MYFDTNGLILIVMLKRVFTTSIFIVYGLYSFSQSIAVGSIRLEEAMRDLQLLDRIPQEYSFTNRPYSLSKNFSIDSLYKWVDEKYYNSRSFNHKIIDKKAIKLTLLPAELTQQFNSKTPFGYNDGSFLKARGYQVNAMAG